MASTFTVSSAADATRLTTLQMVKDDLGITGDSENEYLTRQIDRVTELILDYLNVERAEDGTRTLGRETIVETFRLERWSEYLILARRPLVSVTSIVEDEDTVVSTDYELEKARGAIRRLSNELPYEWTPTYQIVVTYVAGWLLPGQTGRNLPYPIEDAAISLIKMARSARGRDPMVKSVDIYEVQRTDYVWGGVPGSSGFMPPDIAAKLNPYRNFVVV